MNKAERYDEIKKEVQYINRKIKKELDSNKVAKECYKGIQILLSDIPHGTSILFFGINPGAGYNSETGKILKKYSPQNYNFFNDVECQYSTSFYSLFESIGAEKLLNRSAISNLSYISTVNVTDLKSFKSSLTTELRKEIDECEKDWTLELIDILNPKMIFLAGFTAFDQFSNFTDLNRVKISDFWKTGSYNGIPVISCRRKYSNIHNEDEFKKKLKTHLKYYELV